MVNRMWKQDYGQLLQQNQEMKARLTTSQTTPVATAPTLLTNYQSSSSYSESSQHGNSYHTTMEEMQRLKKMVNISLRFCFVVLFSPKT